MQHTSGVLGSSISIVTTCQVLALPLLLLNNLGVFLSLSKLPLQVQHTTSLTCGVPVVLGVLLLVRIRQVPALPSLAQHTLRVTLSLSKLSIQVQHSGMLVSSIRVLVLVHSAKYLPFLY